jgi:hypothetical protein
MSKPRVCFLASANTISANLDTAYHREFTLETDELTRGCAKRGIELEICQWDAPIDLDRYSGAIVGTVWDYFPKKDQLLGVLEQIETRMPAFNPSKVIRWNIEKHYLRELEERGAPSIPTIWAQSPDPDVINDAYTSFQTDRLVIKPLIGGGAWRLALLTNGEPLPPRDDLPLADCLIQPFLPSVPVEGEYSFLFFGSEFSHALQKVPKSGDYRVQAEYGANEHVHTPRSGELELCERVLAAACDATGQDELLYARVDMVRGLDDRLALMELEIIEPYLYPEQAENMGDIYANALARRLNL